MTYAEQLSKAITVAAEGLSELVICRKCCPEPDRAEKELKRDLLVVANSAKHVLKIEEETLKQIAAEETAEGDWRSDWRAELPTGLDKFARMLLEKDLSAMARRTIKDALIQRREQLLEEIKRDPKDSQYSHSRLLLGDVSACLIELWDQ